ncbi:MULTISPECIES: uroporphyrinogen-III synthase [unclassified Psychrobacter]|uniref:uroporphyrinogen-III synthase n=1 Tax=unclassified Psychrobacter TaxID=196806 RepID=UPI003F959924
MSSMLNHANLTSNSQSYNKSLLPQIVINTRPLERAAALTQHLKSAGLSVVEIPMLTLQSRPITDHDMVRMRQWLAGEYQALVVVSPTAAASGLAVWQALEGEYHVQQSQESGDEQQETESQDLRAPSHLIAVGEATATVLNDTNIRASNYQVLQPTVANNEGMLAMPEIERLQAGDKLLIWRGLGGRRLLVDTLQARGVHIDSIAWYERKMPIEASTQYQQWLQDFLTYCSSQNIVLSESSKPIVVISSGAAFEHWSSIVQDVTIQASALKPATQVISETPHLSLELSDFEYVVLGERLANMVAAQQLGYWRVENLAPETILATIRARPQSA